jgi:hypothetical protein
MKPRTVLLAAALAPAMALAQTSYSRAEIVPRGDPPILVQRVSVCDVQQADLYQRKAAIEADQRAIDRERDAIDREAADLAAEMRNLNSADTAAVAAYNARSDAHNRRVADHNQFVGAANHAAALLNGDSAEFMRYCSTLRYARR